MYASTIAFVGALCYQFRELIPILEEHLDEQEGEVLPHLLMADIERWAEKAVSDPQERSLLERVLGFIELEYPGADEETQELIVVSFLEHFPRPNCPGAELRSLVGPNLRRELEIIG